MKSHDSDSTTEAEPGAGDDVTLAAGSDVVSQIRAHAAKVRSGEAASDEGLQVWTAEGEPSSAEPAQAESDMVDVREPGKLLPNDQTVPLESTRDELAKAIADAKASVSTTQSPDGVMPGAPGTGASVPEAQGYEFSGGDDSTEPPDTVSMSEPSPVAAAVDEEPVVDLRQTPMPAQGHGDSLIDGQSAPSVSTSFWETDQPFRASGIDAPSRLRGSGGIPMMAWIALALVVIVVASVGIAVAIASTGPIT